MRKLIFIVALTVLTTPALQALSVAPGRTEIRLKPGERQKAEITAVNDSKDTVEVQLSEKDWFVLEDNKAVSVNDWLKIKGKKKFVLKPGQSRTVPILVTCPKNVQGELVGMVSFTYIADPDSMVTPMISVSVYVAVDGTEKISGEVKDVAARFWQDSFQAAAVVRNSGNVHLRPTGTITLEDDKGKEVTTLTIRSGDPTYPGRERAYIGKIDGLKLKPGNYVLEADLTYRDVPLKATRRMKIKPDGGIEMMAS